MSTGAARWGPGEQDARLSSRGLPRVAWPGRLSVPGDYMSPKEVRHHHQSIKILIYNTELDQSDKIKYLLKDYIQRLTYIHRPLKAIVQKRSNVYDTHELQTIRHETETYL